MGIINICEHQSVLSGQREVGGLSWRMAIEQPEGMAWEDVFLNFASGGVLFILFCTISGLDVEKLTMEVAGAITSEPPPPL